MFGSFNKILDRSIIRKPGGEPTGGGAMKKLEIKVLDNDEENELVSEKREDDFSIAQAMQALKEHLEARRDKIVHEMGESQYVQLNPKKLDIKDVKTFLKQKGIEINLNPAEVGPMIGEINKEIVEAWKLKIESAKKVNEKPEQKNKEESETSEKNNEDDEKKFDQLASEGYGSGSVESKEENGNFNNTAFEGFKSNEDLEADQQRNEKHKEIILPEEIINLFQVLAEKIWVACEDKEIVRERIKAKIIQNQEMLIEKYEYIPEKEKELLDYICDSLIKSETK